MSVQTAKAIQITLWCVLAASALGIAALIGMELLEVKQVAPGWARFALPAVFFAAFALLKFLPRLLPQYFFRSRPLDLDFARPYMNQHSISERVQLVRNQKQTLDGCLAEQRFNEAWQAQDRLRQELRDLKRMCRDAEAASPASTS